MKWGIKWAARSVASIACLLSAVLLGLAWVATLVSPARFALFEFFGLLGWVACLLAVATTLIAGILKARLWWVPLLFLGLTANSLAFKLFRWPWATASSPNQPEKTFRVLSYNVKNFEFEPTGTPSPMASKIQSFVRDEHPSILCLQEFYTNELTEMEMTRKLLHAGFVDWRYFRSVELRKQESIGIATFSRFPILNTQEVSFGEKTSNSALITDLLWAGDTIRVINVHLQSNRLSAYEYNPEEVTVPDKEHLLALLSRLYRASIDRAKQSEKIAELIKTSPYPLIVCGDMNDLPSTYVYKVISKGLKDSFLERGQGMGVTFRGKLPGLRIDYLFHSPSLRTIEHTVPKVTYSDHYPIVIDLGK